METARIRSWVEAPRWAGFGDWIKKVAWQLELQADVQVEKHFIRETVRFEVSGDSAFVIRFKELLENAIKEYESDCL